MNVPCRGRNFNCYFLLEKQMSRANQYMGELTCTVHKMHLHKCLLVSNYDGFFSSKCTHNFANSLYAEKQNIVYHNTVTL